MPYPRKYQRGYKRRSYRKKNSSSGFGGMSLSSAWKTAKWAAQQAWKLKGLVNSEMLKLDILNTGTTISNAGVVTHMSAIAQGDSDSSRHGNSVYCRSLNIKGFVRINASATSTCYRIAVIIDTQQVGDTSPTFSDIYENSDVSSHLNNATVGRYKVIYNKVYTLVPTNDSAIRYFDINLPMRHHVRFNGSASSDVQKGGIYLVRVSNEATNVPTDNFESRLSYHDN